MALSLREVGACKLGGVIYARGLNLTIWTWDLQPQLLRGVDHLGAAATLVWGLLGSPGTWDRSRGERDWLPTCSYFKG